MKNRTIFTILFLAAISITLTSCSEKAYHNGKEIKVISRRCDPSGCLDKVQYVEGHLPPFEVSPDRIKWR